MLGTKEILQEACSGGYAVGAFNVLNIETAQAVVRAARETASPVIVQITENTLKYAGDAAIVAAVRELIKSELGENWPVALHLDHGQSVQIVKHCLDLGFTSVMYDGSRHDYEENISVTRQVVDMAHKRGVSVQAELGSVFYARELGGAEDSSPRSAQDDMTDPDKVAEFVERTGCDTLAIAIGNAHGFVKERPEPDFERLEKIRAQTDVPLVLHGASDWGVDRARAAIDRGISCFNVDTNSRVAFTAALSAYFYNDPNAAPKPRRYLGLARDAMQQAVEKKMEIYRSVGRVKSVSSRADDFQVETEARE